MGILANKYDIARAAYRTSDELVAKVKPDTPNEDRIMIFFVAQSWRIFGDEIRRDQ